MISTVSVNQLFQRKSIRGLEVISSKSSDTLRDCAQLMENEKIGAVMVEDENKKVVGILTARDVQSAVAKFEDVSSVKAELRK